MGVGGLWDLLKPYARFEGFDYLRDKRVAVDLSYWIVQQETAVKEENVRNPHLRLTFFRTINLFSKLGAFPVFVIDGTPSPLKSNARIARFFNSSGVDIANLPVVKEEGVSVARNQRFTKCIQECVELLELLGMPVLKAKGEAEALCAQLNNEGHVDACITADSDAFLFGANSVVKCLRPNSKEPLECYNMADIEAGLGLKRKHLIAISLLAGNDHDLSGVQGIGLDTALRFVKTFDEDAVLPRLLEIGKGDNIMFPIGTQSTDGATPSSDGGSQKTKSSHCSFCGHPGNKRAHFKVSCEYCGTGTDGCIQKSDGFKCKCLSCDQERNLKEQKKHKNFWLKVCEKISLEPNFPNNQIIEMYLCDDNENLTAKQRCSISWENPNTDSLVDFLSFHHLWDPSYIRKKMLLMLSTIYLREAAKNPVNTLLCGQYEFHSIHRIKIRHGHQFFVVKWRKPTPRRSSIISTGPPAEHSDGEHEDNTEVNESVDLLDESNDPQSFSDDGCCFVLTDECMELVRSAFPDEVARFMREKELKESKQRKTPSLRKERSSEESPNSKGVQLSITKFYPATKGSGEDSCKNYKNSPDDRGKASSPNYSKSARRRLLFD